jgi:hypothetical protein|tara:strand:+ start:635 stop:856 length:222 start_codon:yes stop_codon:yes gene_type:complete
MFKKIPLWLFLLLIIIFLTFSILYGSIIVQHYEYGARFQKIEKIIIKISKFPIEFRQIILFKGGIGTASKKIN